MDPRLRPYIIRSGFYGVYRIGHNTLDWGLITSLVEIWHPQTHTFHLPIGKMTITFIGCCYHIRTSYSWASHHWHM